MKKVDMDLVGMDGNAFFIIGAFRRNAKKQGWSPAEIDAVIDEAKRGDYDHLLQTIMEHCA